jgi:hypothetical protein
MDGVELEVKCVFIILSLKWDLATSRMNCLVKMDTTEKLQNFKELLSNVPKLSRNQQLLLIIQLIQRLLLLLHQLLRRLL